ncbi:MAG: LLM class F420-dependent oxidoreductase [SAR202 cluster bacterium Io17-Chloro-G9]|nr:MAG: LLM class F420-dependent oxidoreductase [SAR202 cluster bacterium Io17-Chloro-G9]
MQLGAIFPQTEIGADPVGVRDFAQAAEAMGYEHLLVFDHVLGADPSKRETWDRPYSHTDMFHEPFVLFGYLAAVTETIKMTTGVLILGQRQTALVAKQAAEVDVLTGGRLRLGIGIGWNHVEYEALGEDFNNRGRRSAEQIRLLRALWTEDVVSFEGRYHKVSHAGINPLPVQRPIPIWFGGGADRVMRRIGRLADGWFPQFQPDSQGQEQLAKMREYANAAGRDPGDIGIEGRVSIASGNPSDWAKSAAAWDELGASHLSVNTMRAGLKGPDQHIEAIRKFKDAVSG